MGFGVDDEIAVKIGQSLDKKYYRSILVRLFGEGEEPKVKKKK